MLVAVFQHSGSLSVDFYDEQIFEMPFVVHDNGGGWVRDRIRRDEHAQCARVRDALDRIANAPTFDPHDVRALADRATFPIAASLLNFTCWGLDGALSLLHQECALTPSARVIRAAAVCGIIKAHDRDGFRTDINWLRRFDHPRGEVAMALLGEINWATASIDARRAFLLRELVSTFRERAS